MAAAALVLWRKTGCVIAPITQNRRRTYEFKVRLNEAMTIMHAASLQKGGRKSSKGTFGEHPRTFSTTHFAFLCRFRGGPLLPLHLDHDRTTILFSRRCLSSARTDGVGIAWDTRYFHLATPIDCSRAREGMFAGMFDALARQTLSTSSLVYVLLFDIQGAPFQSFKRQI